MPITSIEPGLLRPPLPPQHIARPRLLAALDEGNRVPLTLLSAGPGTGKTVLLTEWSLQRPEYVAWLSLTRADDEPQRFWRLLVSSLQASGALSGSLGMAVRRTPSSDLVPALLAKLRESSAPLVVIIDDAHVITNPDVLDGLDRFIRGRPGRLVLAARSDPLLPLHRYRLAGGLNELRANQLAMIPREIRQLLAVHGIILSPRDFDALVNRTEGWTTGVRLSAMRMEGNDRPGEFVSELAVDQGSVGEYLINEVLERQPEPMRRLLVETSFADEVNGSLADAITGMHGCTEMLTELARTNSFVIPLDTSWSRFRYHQLLSEILRHLLQRWSRQRVPTLFGRAAAWYADRGDVRRSLQWCMRARDGEQAVSVLLQGGLARAFVNRVDLSDCGLLDLLPLSHPTGPATAQQAVARSAIAAIHADAAAAAPELERHAVIGAGLSTDDLDLAVTADLVELILGQKAGASVAVDAAAERILDRDLSTWPGQVPGLKAAVLLAQAATHLWSGHVEDVDDLLQQALAFAEREGPQNLQIEILSMIVFVDTWWSRPNHADEAARHAHELLRESDDLAPAPALDLAAAMRSLIGADLSGLSQMLERTALAHVTGSDPGLSDVRDLVRGALLLASQRVDEARVVLHECPHSSGHALLAAHRDMLLAEGDTDLGRPQAALRRLLDYRRTDFADLISPACARAYLAQGDVRRAQNSVRSTLTTTNPHVGRFQIIEAMLLDAQIAVSSGEPGRAVDVLLHSIDIANGDIALPFLRSTDTFADLLMRHPAVAARWPTPPADLSAIRIPRGPSAPVILEALTERERAVARFLATNMSTAEIADEMCLSVNTVKTHLAAIYRKLAVRKRREAVVRAWELELL